MWNLNMCKSENFPTTPDGFIAASGPHLSQLSGGYAVDYWRMQELSTDEAIIPARGGNYVKQEEVCRRVARHSWTKDHTTVKNVELGFRWREHPVIVSSRFWKKRLTAIPSRRQWPKLGRCVRCITFT